jgi:thioesterase domain-containing protein
VSDRPTLSTVEKLTEIWQQALQRPSIGPEDSFYDFAGSDTQADKIFAEVARVFGRELPSATICHAPTIAALAALLEQPTFPRFSPFVPLKAGSQMPPILITHGVGGRASFSELAKCIHTAHPVYGVQAKGVDGMEEPFERIEDMAAFYLDELNRLPAQGPYILIGYSFGGLVALEMAQRLSDEGKRVALLVLVDSYPHPRYFPLGQRLWLLAKRARGHLFEKKRVHASPLPKQRSKLSFELTTAHVKESDFRALARYRPRFYKGKIRFVRPESNSYLPNNPAALWKNLAAGLEVETVPGDHLSMIGKHYDALAAVLTRYVEESDVAKSRQEISQR